MIKEPDLCFIKEPISFFHLPDGVLPARLGPLHHRNPLLVVGEEVEVEQGRRREALGRDWKLGKHALACLAQSTILRDILTVYKSK